MTKRQRRMAARRLSYFARNDGAAGRGRKSIGAVAPKAVEASAVIRPDQSIEEAVWLRAVRTELTSRRTWRSASPLKELAQPNPMVMSSLYCRWTDLRFHDRASTAHHLHESGWPYL